MGKEANLRHKTRKTSVLLYRAFLKLSLAGAIYATYLVLRGSTIAETGFAVAVSIIGAVAFEIAYCVYKAKKKENLDVSKDATWGQVLLLVKMILYFCGLFSLLYGARFVSGGKYAGIALIVMGLALCHQLHNNKSIFSHLSTFSENAAAGFIIITLELIYVDIGLGLQQWLWLIPGIITVVLYALTEVFFHFFNMRKHKGKASGKQLFLDRLAQFLRNSLVVVIIYIAWIMLIISGCVQFVIDLGIYDKAIAIIPIVISVVTPALDAQKQNKAEKPKVIKYDPRISPENLKTELQTKFKDDSVLPIRALDYVTANMNKENKMTRYNGDDYYVHPIAVAKILMDNTDADHITVTAALLHDCIEDIEGFTYETILTQYDNKTELAGIVKLVSKEKGVDYSVKENMDKYMDGISKNVKASLVKIADRMNNNSTMDNRTEGDKAKKTTETKVHYIPLVSDLMTRDTKNEAFYKLAEEFFSKDIV